MKHLYDKDVAADLMFAGIGGGISAVRFYLRKG